MTDEWTANEDALDYEDEELRHELWLDEQIDRLREQQREDIWEAEERISQTFDAQMKKAQKLMGAFDANE